LPRSVINRESRRGSDSHEIYRLMRLASGSTRPVSALSTDNSGFGQRDCRLSLHSLLRGNDKSLILFEKWWQACVLHPPTFSL
jgi:hypothetical protein